MYESLYKCREDTITCRIKYNPAEWLCNKPCLYEACSILFLYLNDITENALNSIYSAPSAHHVVGEDGQQQFQFIRVDVDVGLDRVP